jgi:hypothetical protein
MQAALERDDRLAIGELALSGALDEMGEFDPEVTRHILRALATPHLLRAIESDSDTLIVNAYDASLFDDDPGISGDVRDRIELARRREGWLADVRSALRGRDATTLRLAVDAVEDLAQTALSSVERERIQRLLQQDSAVKTLDVALESGEDTAIVDALAQVEAAGATLPDDLDWSAIRAVIDRLSLVTSIRRAALSDPPDRQRLARLLPQARMESGGEPLYLGQELDFETLEEDIRREAHRGRLRESIARGDERAIVAAALPDLYGTMATLSDAERQIVERAIASGEKRQAISKKP